MNLAPNRIPVNKLAHIHRRQLLGEAGGGLGLAALATLLGNSSGRGREPAAESQGGLAGLPHHPSKARRVVMLWQGGGPSHLDLFDDKPRMRDLAGQDIPDE